jgi:hypothetical protein
MLTGHPNIAIPEENNLFANFVSPDRRNRGEPLGEQQILRTLDLLKRRTPSLFGASQSTTLIARRASELGVRSYAELMRIAYSTYAESCGRTRWGDKSPNNALHVLELADAYQDAQFIHIFQDGRTVATSLASMNWGFGSVTGAAYWWRNTFKQQ